MRELDIDDKMTAPPYVGFTADLLTGFMLLPDPEKRAEFIKTSKAQFHTQPDTELPAILRVHDDRAFLANAHAPQHWYENRKIVDAGHHGLLCGMIYRAAILEHQVNGEFKLDHAKEAVLRHLRDRAIKIRHAKLDKILKQHRPCGHLWAARADFVELVGKEIAVKHFPCPRDPAGLKDFLARGRFFQELGLRIRAPQRGHPLFDPETLWRVPAKLNLGSPARLAAQHQLPAGDAWMWVPARV